MTSKLKKLKILIVDDVPVNLNRMADILMANENYLVAKAKNGKSALQKAKANQFDLILLDIIMPDIDGFEVCRQLKEYNSTKGVPVIFITSDTDPNTIEKGFNAGGVDYISKPFSPEELLARTRLHLKLEQSQQQLIKSKEKAEATTYARSLFLANMSHDLKTPLNGIMGMADVLTLTDLDDKQAEYVSIIQKSGENLLKMITDIMDYTRMQTGQIKLEEITFNIRNTINEITQLVSFYSREKQIDFVCNFHGDVPEKVIGDPNRVKQLFTNLLNNITKYTENGTVEIQVSVERTANESIRLKFSITDTGIVSSEELKNKIILSLSQSELSVSKNNGDTELGLAISKYLTFKMNGDIGAENIPENKAMVWFVLNFVRADNVSDTDVGELIMENPVLPKKDYNILLVDDNSINQDVARYILQQYGKIDVAENGKVAVDKFRLKKYDVIYMDIQMPVMDGVEATKRIREIEQDNKADTQVKIIAMTANNTVEEKRKLMSLGMDGFIGKPFKPKDVEAIFLSLQFM